MVGESKNQVYRFIRLIDLITPLLDLVDAKKMPLATAVEVSYLDKEKQQNLAEFIGENGMVKSYQIAAVRKYLDEYQKIGKAKLFEMLMDGFNAKTMPKSITIPENKLKKYFSSNYTVKDMEKIIYRLLDELEEKYNYSARHLARHLQGNKLIPPLKDMLDDGRLAMVSAVDAKRGDYWGTGIPRSLLSGKRTSSDVTELCVLV